ncbi:MAG: hypothetical protein ACYC61_27560, partial [Isosphaeraceae bacterium]
MQVVPVGLPDPRAAAGDRAVDRLRAIRRDSIHAGLGVGVPCTGPGIDTTGSDTGSNSPVAAGRDRWGLDVGHREDR